MKRSMIGMMLLSCWFTLPVQAQAQPRNVQAALKAHNKAVLVKDDIWIRDPYIVLAPDGYYYLTGTTQMPGVALNETSKYNVGLGDSSKVGWSVRVWKSRDLANWEYTGEPFRLTDGYWAKKKPEAFKNTPQAKWHLWAPELHFVKGKWILLHTTPGPVKRGSNVAVTRGSTISGPYDFPLGDRSEKLHDPSLFQDTDGKVYLVWGNTQIVELTPDLTGFVGAPQEINPSTLREMPDSTRQPGIGHEGCTLLKIGNKYVLFGTGWSTNKGRRGSYNLYYAVADHVKGPYGPRQFVGRFLGHGTPFKDKDGNWWCTAFYNSNVPPLDAKGIQERDLRDDAYTINKQGVTLVPLEVKTLKDGTLSIRAKDADYATPGPDEVQKF